MGYSPWVHTESDMTEATYNACMRIPHNSGLILKFVEMGNKKISFCQVTRDLGLFRLIALPFVWWGSCPHELKQNSNDCNHISSSRIQEVKEKNHQRVCANFLLRKVHRSCHVTLYLQLIGHNLVIWPQTT